MGVVSTIPERCKRCYVCVRECPAKAIKVVRGQATVIEELCIACGNCVKVCAQKAKRIEDSTAFVKKILSPARGEADTASGRVFACLAPSFPVAFHPTEPGRIVTALRRLGFSDVWEVAFGAELISREYARLIKEVLDAGRSVISSPCPAIVSFVQKYMPRLLPLLAPIVSPMLAVARVIRRRYPSAEQADGAQTGAQTRVVFIGPCIAKKNEIRDPDVQGEVDAVLTFEELQQMFLEAEIRPEELEPGGFDGPACSLGRALPISGGLLRSSGLNADILENAFLITEGKDRVLAVLREIAEGRSRARLFDLLFCEGCINGPKIGGSLSVFARKELLADYIVERNRSAAHRELGESLAGRRLAMHRPRRPPPGVSRPVDLGRGFRQQAVVLPQPTEEAVLCALQSMRKLGPEDELNCGSCGYPTCRDKAVAVCQGLAEPEMCLPYLVEELGSRLQQSNQELTSAQMRLIQTERLASMGQISAGVAHEINNPLSTILLYSHMLLKRAREGNPDREDLQMIVSEATRCRTIMRGLLDFARHSRVEKQPTDLAALIRQVVADMSLKAQEAPIRVNGELPEPLPPVFLDAGQVRQMLTNLVQNGIDALRDGGEVTVTARAVDAGAGGVGGGTSSAGGTTGAVEIRVRDTGCGIPKENLSQLFTPFFTTKQLGKGTGLGLSIVYGVVKMHSGDISVESEEGKGTTFIVRLPVKGETP